MLSRVTFSSPISPTFNPSSWTPFDNVSGISHDKTEVSLQYMGEVKGDGVYVVVPEDKGSYGREY